MLQFCKFRKYTVDYKLETYMKIARLYLEDDDPMLAESYINRASLLQVKLFKKSVIFKTIYCLFCGFQTESKNEKLQICYKVCYARVLDYRRKFIEAAQRYNELSYKTIISEEERMTALKNALICTVLASAGKMYIDKNNNYILFIFLNYIYF